MKILSILNPQKWGGQIILLALVISTSFMTGMYYGTKNCPPVTQVAVKQKVKKNSSATLDFNSGSSDCLDCLKGRSMSDIRKAWKEANKPLKIH